MFIDVKEVEFWHSRPSPNKWLVLFCFYPGDKGISYDANSQITDCL